MLYKLLSYLNPVWYAFSFHGYAKRATICSPHLLPAGGACPQTEGPVGKRTSRYVHYIVSHLFNTLIIFAAAVFTLLCLYLIFSLSSLRFLPAPYPSHNVCTEFLLPTSRPGAGHWMWHPGNPVHADQQQLCTDEPGLVCSLYIWIHAARWGCQTSLRPPASDIDCSFKVRLWRL